jgi:predicted phosphodiesterase
MNVLVISDIHANLAALDVVLREPHDLLLCLGDLVGFGPEPAACVRRVREEPGVVVQGDHDRAAAEGRAASHADGLEQLVRATAPTTARDLGPEERDYLGSLPRWAITADPGPRCLLVHGTPGDLLYGTVDLSRSDWPPDLRGVRADVILVGQAHRQFDRTFGTTRVVCPGSVGLPLDGDPRAGYAVIRHGEVALRRAAYPIERTIQALDERGLEPKAGEQLARALRLGRATPAAGVAAAGVPLPEPAA